MPISIKTGSSSGTIVHKVWRGKVKIPTRINLSPIICSGVSRAPVNQRGILPQVSADELRLLGMGGLDLLRGFLCVSRVFRIVRSVKSRLRACDELARISRAAIFPAASKQLCAASRRKRVHAITAGG